MTRIAAYEAVHDPLTSLLNRTALLARGDEVLRGLEHGTPVALLLLDVNHFHDVNDTLGPRRRRRAAPGARRPAGHAGRRR